MPESILTWASYLMIIAVTILVLSGLISMSPSGKGQTKILRKLFLPLLPIVVFVMIYVFVAYPANLYSMNKAELAMFEYGLQAVSAGVTVYVLLCIVIALNAGLLKLINKIQTLRMRSR